MIIGAVFQFIRQALHLRDLFLSIVGIDIALAVSGVLHQFRRRIPNIHRHGFCRQFADVIHRFHAGNFQSV